MNVADERVRLTAMRMMQQPSKVEIILFFTFLAEVRSRKKRWRWRNIRLRHTTGLSLFRQSSSSMSTLEYLSGRAIREEHTSS
eukprot:scaffold164393_cov40-Cyclotella_meneghiniana.AAC.1